MVLEEELRELQKGDFALANLRLINELHVSIAKAKDWNFVSLYFRLKDVDYTLRLDPSGSFKGIQDRKDHFSPYVREAFSQALVTVRQVYARKIELFHDYCLQKTGEEYLGDIFFGAPVFGLLKQLPRKPFQRGMAQKDLDLQAERYLGWVLVEQYAEESKKSMEQFLQTDSLQQDNSLYDFYQTLNTQAGYHQTRLKRLYTGIHKEVLHRQGLAVKWRDLEGIKRLLLERGHSPQ